MSLTRVTSEVIKDNTIRGEDIQNRGVPLTKLERPAGSSPGDILIINNSDELEFKPIELEDVSDIDLTGADVGDVLTWNGTGWVAESVGTGGGGGGLIDDLLDVAVFNPTNGDALFYNSVTGVWANRSIAYSDISGAPIVPVNLGDLSDIDTTGAIDGSVLKYSSVSGNWIIGIDENTSGATDLAGLDDTDIGTATSGDYLFYNGVDWVGKQVQKADITDFNEADYATAAQGLLANTATQPGDAISTLTNDANFVSTGDNISLLTNDAGYLTSVPTIGLSGLSDVDTTGVTTGQVLKYNGTSWVPDTAQSGSGGIDLTDLSVTVSPAGTTNLSYDNTTGEFTYTPPDLSGFITSYTETSTLADVTARGASTTDRVSLDGGISLAGGNVYSPTSPNLITDDFGIKFRPTNNTGTDGPSVVISYNDGISIYSLTEDFLVGVNNAAPFEISGSNTSTAGIVPGIMSIVGGRNSTDGTFGEVRIGNVFGGTTSFRSDVEFTQTDSVDFTGANVIGLELTDLGISDGTSGQVLTTDGAGGFTFTTVSGGAATWGSITGTLGDQTDLQSALNGKADSVHTHVKADITDFSDADYATAAQGLLANTATQPGDNISTLTNDAGYLTSVPDQVLTDLTDVDTAGATTGQVLKYNGTSWAPDTDVSGGGETNTASNLGAGEGVFAAKVVEDLQFKSLIAGTNITLSSDTNTITINSSGGSSVTSIGDLTDVDTTTVSPTTGQVLKWNGTAWVPGNDETATGGTGATELNELNDVTFTVPATGDFLYYNGSTWTDKALVKADITDFSDADYATAAQGLLADTATQPGDAVSTLTNDAGYLTSVELDDITNVNTTGVTSGQVLTYNGTTWDAQTPSSGGASTLNDLTDVDTTGATTGQVLKYNGSNWTAEIDVGFNISNAPGGGTELVNITGPESVAIKTLSSGLGIDLTVNFGNQVIISSTLTSPAVTGANLVKNAGSIKRLREGTGVSVTESTDFVQVSLDASTLSLDSLNNVDTTGVTAGQVLTYNGTSWDAQTVSGGSSDIVSLTDTSGTAVANGYLRWNATGTQVVYETSIAASDITGLSTVATTGSYSDLIDVPATFTPSVHTHVKADITDFNEADYATAAQGLLADTATQPGDNISTLTNDAGYLTSVPDQVLTDLTDVDTTGVTTGQVLTYNGTSWDAQTPSSGATNLGVANINTSTLDVTSDTGTDATLPAATPTTAGLMTGADKTKLNGISAGAEVNQNAFTTVTLSGNTAGDASVVADSASDTITIVGGTGITLTGNAAGDSITIDSAGGTGEANTASNLGAGEGLATAKSGTDLPFKSLVAGTGVTLSSTADEITINSTGGSGGGATVEWAVLQFQGGDTFDSALTTTSSNVSVTSYDGTAANRTGFTFSGYNFPPAGYTIYSQNAAVGNWTIFNTSDLIATGATISDAAGGSASPDLIDFGSEFTGEVTLGLNKSDLNANNGPGLPPVQPKILVLFTMIG